MRWRDTQSVAISSVARMSSGVVTTDSSCGVACTAGACALLRAAPVHDLAVCQVTHRLLCDMAALRAATRLSLPARAGKT